MDRAHDELFAPIRELTAARNLSVQEMAQRLLDIRSALPPTPEQLGPLARAATGLAPPLSGAEIELVLDEEITRQHAVAEQAGARMSWSPEASRTSYRSMCLRLRPKRFRRC
jgi:hypothetical protein